MIETKNYKKTKVGLVNTIYLEQIYSSEKRGHDMPNYSSSMLFEWFTSQEGFDELYAKWVDGGYDKRNRPSSNRIDDYKPYTLDNIELMTWEQNLEKAHSDRKEGINNKGSKGVMQFELDGKFIKEYPSASYAAREMGLNNSHISACCRGERKSCGNFLWKYFIINTNNMTDENVKICDQTGEPCPENCSDECKEKCATSSCAEACAEKESCCTEDGSCKDTEEGCTAQNDADE